MNDDDLTPPAELASAALDGHTTADERATVESTASLRDEMSFYVGLRDQLAAVDVPSSARESALAAALAVFDELQFDSAREGDTATPPVAPVIALHERRKRQYRWLGGAAAAAFAVVVGVGVINGGSSDDGSNNSAFSQRSTSDSSAKAVPDASGSAEQAYDTAADSAGEDANDTMAAESEMASPAGAAPNSTAAGAIDSIDSPAILDLWVAAQQLGDGADVIAFADSLAAPTLASVTDETVAETAETTAESSLESTSNDGGSADGADPFACLAPYSGPFAPAYYQARKVFVVDDTANGAVLVIDPVDCTLIESFDR